MVTKTNYIADKNLRIGDVFTPIKWATFAITEFGIFEKWLAGASVFDPTMGEGNLLEALVVYGLSKGFTLNKLPAHNLFGNELNTVHYLQALSKFKTKFGLDMAAQFTNEDIVKLPPNQYDIILGNPPWQNFVDLPESYKEQIKNHFVQYNLTGNRKNLLLGNSRIDIAALIIQVAIKDFLQENGEAIFFMPLSILLNDGANKHFRHYKIDNIPFCLQTVYDFNEEAIFKDVATRYGLSHFKRNHKQQFPIPYCRLENNKWLTCIAQPIFDNTDPLSILPANSNSDLEKIKPIVLSSSSRPRQGINTCGANDVFFFDTLMEKNNELVVVSNKFKSNIVLPRKYIYPLITAKQFREQEGNKWVLLPYATNGKPLDWQEIEHYPELKTYLETNKEKLHNRKGTMLQATIRRGYWWALLGVGEYNFAAYKIVWEAYGKSSFNPTLFEGQWQANQALQAFIPEDNLKEAKRILALLNNKKVEQYLRSLKMEGTMNWAQPGKIQKFIQYKD